MSVLVFVCCLYRIYSIAAMHKMTTELISIYIRYKKKQLAGR